MFKLHYFPYEILAYIFKFVGPNSVYSLSLTCRTLADVFKHNKMYILGLVKDIKEFRKLTPYEPLPEQVEMLYHLKRVNKPLSMIQAPMGTGKTTMMILLALLSDSPSIFVINTRIYTSWIQEFKNFGLSLHQDPDKSDVLIVHVKYPKHRDFVYRNYNSKPIPREHKLILTTTYYICNGYNLESCVDANSQIIVDEAHLTKYSHMRSFEYLSRGNMKLYLFSASPMNSLIGMRDTELLRPANVFMGTIKETSTDSFPKLRHSRMRLSLGYENIKDFLNRKRMVKYKHIVICTHAKLSYLRDWKTDLKKSTGREIIVFSNTAPTSLKRWEKSDNAVILCNYLTSSEGTNFLRTDCAIYFNFGHVSMEKARQTIGRVRRASSEHSTIRVYFCDEAFNEPNSTFIKSRINQQYAVKLGNNKFGRKTDADITRICSYMEKDKIDLDKLTLEEIRIIFGVRAPSPDIDFSNITLPLKTILKYTIL